MNFWYRPPGLAAWLLWPASLVYAAITGLWHLLFTLNLRRPTRIEGARVLSVGNLVVGGSGKTPVVIHLTNEALRAGHRVAVLSRGYGRQSTDVVEVRADRLPDVSACGDEPRLIARRCPGAVVWVGPSRVVLARRAVAAGANLLILDDGFQHRQLARDVDLLLDAGQGNGFLMPAGPLREAASHRARATHIWARDGRAGDFHADHQVRSVRAPDGTRHTSLAGRRVALLLGVARPERVIESVRALGGEIAQVLAHADHHVFTPAELAAARANPDLLVVTTEKDAERLPPDFPAWVLELNVEVTQGDVRRLFS